MIPAPTAGVELLKPSAVIAGHKMPESDDDPGIIAETRQYLRDFDHPNASTKTARQLYDAMLELYTPAGVNPGSLRGAAKHRQEADVASLPHHNEAIEPTKEC